MSPRDDNKRANMAVITKAMREIGPLLEQYGFEQQGGILGFAVATWVARHRVQGGGDYTEFQTVTLEGFIDLVNKLLPITNSAADDTMRRRMM